MEMCIVRSSFVFLAKGGGASAVLSSGQRGFVCLRYSLNIASTAHRRRFVHELSTRLFFRQPVAIASFLFVSAARVVVDG